MKCYHNGTIYPDEVEFMKSIQFFNSSPVNPQSIETLCREFIENLKVNLIDCRELDKRNNNMQLRHLLEKALLMILDESKLSGEIEITSRGDKCNQVTIFSSGKECRRGCGES